MKEFDPILMQAADARDDLFPPVPAVIGVYRKLESCYLIRLMTEQDTGRERIYLFRIDDAQKRLAHEITETGRGRGE